MRTQNKYQIFNEEIQILIKIDTINLFPLFLWAKKTIFER